MVRPKSLKEYRRREDITRRDYLYICHRNIYFLILIGREIVIDQFLQQSSPIYSIA
jgi:hypothetical protein